MSNSSWQSGLRNAVLHPTSEVSRISLIGAGQVLNGDDGAGPAAIRLLETRGHMPERFQLLDAGAFPENHTGSIRRFQPQLVVFIDAAQMDQPPGSIRLLELTEIGGLSAATHSLPFGIIGKYLQDEVGCRVMVLGIQPLHNLPNTPLSRVMFDVVQLIASFIEELAHEHDIYKRIHS